MMRLIGRWVIAVIVGGASLLAFAAETLAQAYPARPIRLVIPFSPGGPTDILGRTVAQKLGEILPAPVIVESRLGGGGIFGYRSVATATADGYTILLGDHASSTVNPHLYKSLPYDTRKDFTPIGSVASGTIILWVGASVPARNVQELIVLAKSKPGELSYGSGGAGQLTHVVPELFKMKNGLDILHVPYKGAGPAMVDVAAGRVSFAMTAGLAAARPFLEAGKVRAFALTGDKRSAALPGVPTFAEAGFPLPEMNAGTWWGFMGPAGLPRDIVVKLNGALAEAMAAQDVRARLAALDMEPMTTTPEAFANLIQTTIEMWAQALKRMNIKPE